MPVVAWAGLGTGLGTGLEAGLPSRSQQWGTGTQPLGPSLLPPRVCIDLQELVQELALGATGHGTRQLDLGHQAEHLPSL